MSKILMPRHHGVVIILLLFSFSFCNSIQAQSSYHELNGKDAKAFISGTEKVIVDDQTGLPIFINFEESQLPSTTQIGLYFSKLFGAKKN